MADSAPAGPEVVRARKRKRMSFKQEIQTIQNLPKLQRLVVILKVAGVFLVAIGLEGIVTGNLLLALVFVLLGVIVSIYPIRIHAGRCLACARPLSRDQAICPECGAPQV